MLKLTRVTKQHKLNSYFSLSLLVIVPFLCSAHPKPQILIRKIHKQQTKCNWFQMIIARICDIIGFVPIKCFSLLKCQVNRKKNNDNKNHLNKCFSIYLWKSHGCVTTIRSPRTLLCRALGKTSAEHYAVDCHFNHNAYKVQLVQFTNCISYSFIYFHSIEPTLQEPV